jgi:hypothetical protein
MARTPLPRFRKAVMDIQQGIIQQGLNFLDAPVNIKGYMAQQRATPPGICHGV